MGNIFSEKQTLYLCGWTPAEPNDVCKAIHDPGDLPHPLQGRVLIPFSQINKKREFLFRNHHQVVLLNDVPELGSLYDYQFKGVPVVDESDLAENIEKCLQLPFQSHQCHIPLVLERFNQSLLKNYLTAFSHHNLKVQYYDRLEHFLQSDCENSQLICSNIELQQLSCRIQNLTFKREQQKKMTILCFCNKDQYIFPKKTEVAMQSNNIEVVLFQNMLEVIDKINLDRLISPPGPANSPQKIFFYLNEKEKDYDYLLKMGKKIERNLRGLKVIKVVDKTHLIQKIRDHSYSIVLFSSDTKEMKGHLQIYQALEEAGLEDRAIFLKRDSQIGSKTMHRIDSTVNRHKYIKLDIIDKSLIFFGTLQNFKNTLRLFPKLNFKKFIDSNKDKQSLKQFLKVKTEVVMTHLQVCECRSEWGPISCRMIYVKCRSGSQKMDKAQTTLICPKQKWFSSQKELISHFNANGEILYGLNFDYSSRKMSIIGKIISQIFSKLKQKKTVLLNELYGSIFLFSCEYYFLDQISGFITKYFTSKTLGSFDHYCLLPQLKFKLFREVLMLHKNAGVEEEVLNFLQKDESQNIFELSDRIVNLAVEYPYFLEEINSVWQLFLHQDRPEYINNCQTLLFLMLLSFNKTSFTEYHNETLQHLTLKVKTGIVGYEDQCFSAFAAKTKNSFVYNFSFLVCQEFKNGDTPQPGDILIRLEGSELNNFGLYLPVWRKESQFLLAPLTKFELITSKVSGVVLKLSLNGQQKMLQKFTEHFLSDKECLRLFKEPREIRKLDCFLESMCSGKFQTAGFIIKKMVREEKIVNHELLNAYIILHHLKCGDIEQAHTKLQKGKYYDILSRLISSCKEGSSIEAAHSSFTADINDRRSVDSGKSSEIVDQELTRNATTDFRNKCKRTDKRSPSDIFRRDKKNSKGRRIPVPVMYHSKKNAQTSMMGTENQSCLDQEEEEEVKIKIFSPQNQSVTISDESSILESKKKTTAIFTPNTLLDHTKSQSTVKQAFQCSLSRLNSCNSEKSFISELFQFEDHIDESLEDQNPLIKRISKKKPSNFYQIQSEKSKNTVQIDEASYGTGTSTGNFNFCPKEPERKEEEEYVNEELDQQNQYGMTPVAEEESEKLSESQVDTHMLSTTSDFFKFRLGFNPNGEKLIPNKRKSLTLPRNSIQQDRNDLMNKLGHQPQLGDIEEESCVIPSNTYISRTIIGVSNASGKENNEPQSSQTHIERPQGKKLFTFCKNEEIRPRFSGSGSQSLKIPSSSLLISQDSHVEIVDPNAKLEREGSLFCIFGEQQKSELQEMNSISSIDLIDADPVAPQNLRSTNNT